MREVYISGMGIDPISQMPIVFLKAKDDESMVLPIWIGVFEANSIVSVMQGLVSPRPMTYELMKNIIEALKYNLKMVTIDSIQDKTYIASIYLESPDKLSELIIDSRPSDAINLALRFDVPIYVSEELFDHNLDVDVQDDLSITEEDLKDWIENIKPEDFEKNT